MDLVKFSWNFRKIRRARSGLALRLLGPWGSCFCQGSRSPASSASGAGEPFDPGGSTQFVASTGRFRTARSVSQVTRSQPLVACVAGGGNGPGNECCRAASACCRVLPPRAPRPPELGLVFLFSMKLWVRIEVRFLPILRSAGSALWALGGSEFIEVF